MKKVIAFFSIFLFFGVVGAYAQKASIHVRLVDRSAPTPSEFVFEVEIRNDSFPSYWVQDTSFIKKHYGYEGWAHFYINVEKKVNGEYKAYENRKRNRGDLASFDSCWDHCCPCIFLNPGQSVKMDLPLLEPYNLEKGDYEMEVNIAAPDNVCGNCEQIGEIYTTVYFRVGARPSDFQIIN